MKKKLLITIDGPAGAGKSTVSRILAKHIEYNYIDTGALYRAIALEIKLKKIDPNDETSIKKICSSIKLEYIKKKEDFILLLNNKDIRNKIRTNEISMLASTISKHKIIRTYLLGFQKKLGEQKGVIFEGRDMGTVVFPDADIKFYLDGSTKERAKRRYLEILDDRITDCQVDLKDIEKEILVRDNQDKKRKLAPLKPATDAIIIDSTNLSIEDVIKKMLSYIKI